MGRVGTAGWGEAALGSFTVALSSAAYLSFLEGLLGQLVASLQPCEGAVGRVLCWEHELRETPSRERRSCSHHVQSSSSGSEFMES